MEKEYYICSFDKGCGTGYRQKLADPITFLASSEKDAIEKAYHILLSDKTGDFPNPKSRPDWASHFFGVVGASKPRNSKFNCL